jgi:hypothetical protein
MIDRLVLTRRIEEIDKHLAKIEPYAGLGLDDFLAYNYPQITQITQIMRKRPKIGKG